MSVETDPVPPVPEHTPPVQEDANASGLEKRFNHTWTRWFVSLREKVNVINTLVANLSQVVGNGFVALDGDTIIPRSIEGTTGRVVVTNGDGVLGNPTVDLDVSGITAGTKPGGMLAHSITFDDYGRATGSAAPVYTSSATATAGGSALPATPEGFITIELDFGSGPTPVKIPYYLP